MTVEEARARPIAGWIKAIRNALGMSQSDLARRLGVSAEAVNKLEHAELRGGITIAKLSEVARALDCTLVYTLVPNTTLEQTVMTQARAEVRRVLDYAAHTMALEDQRIEDTRRDEAIEEAAWRLVEGGGLWRPNLPAEQT